MQSYGSEISGVDAFEIGESFIIVRFKSGETYLYNNEKTGQRNVERMKKLAPRGRGLSTYISQHVKGAYAAKL